MNSIDQTTRKDGNGVVAGFLKGTLKTGLGVAENMHQFAVEIPLNMLQVVGVSDEQTKALKDKHRSLLRSVYGSIDSVASGMTDVGEKQADLLADGIRELASGLDKPAVEKKAKKVVKEAAKAVKKKEPATAV